jgi:Resolvase, N terminal domain
MTGAIGPEGQRESLTTSDQNMPVRRAAVYLRTSTPDQNPESQLHDLRQVAAQRGFQIVEIYLDQIGVPARAVQSLTIF